jgi:MFS family permease
VLKINYKSDEEPLLTSLFADITYIFGMAGYSGNANLLASSIQYIINVIMTVPALIWMDQWGRRWPLIIGAFCMMSFMFVNAAMMGATGVVYPDGVGGVKQQSMLVSGAPAKGLIACTYLFVASYAISWGPISWVYPPEVYPLRVRGKAVALATSANWAFNTALGAFVPTAFETIRWKVYIIFGVFNLCMLLHVAFLFPETAGKTLEEVQLIFEDPNGLPYIGTPAWKTHKAAIGMEHVERGNLGPKGFDDEKSFDEPAGTVEVKGV